MGNLCQSWFMIWSMCVLTHMSQPVFYNLIHGRHSLLKYTTPGSAMMQEAELGVGLDSSGVRKDQELQHEARLRCDLLVFPHNVLCPPLPSPPSRSTSTNVFIDHKRNNWRIFSHNSNHKDNADHNWSRTNHWYFEHGSIFAKTLYHEKHFDQSALFRVLVASTKNQISPEGNLNPRFTLCHSTLDRTDRWSKFWKYVHHGTVDSCRLIITRLLSLFL